MQCGCAILSSVVCPTLKNFSTLSHKRHDFRKKKIIAYEICFDFLNNFIGKVSYHKRTEQDTIKMCIGLHVIYPLFLSDCNENLTFLTDFRKKKNNEITNLMKISPVGAEPFHEEGRTDRHNEANICFYKFCERAPKMIKYAMTY